MLKNELNSDLPCGAAELVTASEVALVGVITAEARRLVTKVPVETFHIDSFLPRPRTLAVSTSAGKCPKHKKFGGNKKDSSLSLSRLIAGISRKEILPRKVVEELVTYFNPLEPCGLPDNNLINKEIGSSCYLVLFRVQ